MTLKPPADPTNSVPSFVDTFDSRLDDLEAGSAGGRVSVLEHGADPTGVADCSEEFTAAWTAAGRAPVYVPEGTYRLTTIPFSGDDPLTLVGDGIGRTVINLENVNLAAITGTIGSAVLLTASANVGATTLTLASTSGLTAGDYLILRDTDQVLAGTSGAAYAGVVGEVVRVKSVDSGTVITIWGAVEQQMTLASGNLSVRKLNLVDGVHVSDLTIRNPNPATYTGGNARGLQFVYCQNVRVDRVRFEQLDDDGNHVKSCVDWRFTDCEFYDLQNTGGRTPYGVVAVNASCNGLMHNCRQTYGRHMFTTSGDDGEIGPAHIMVSNCQAWHATGSPFDTHPAGRHITFDTCEAHACGAGSFLIRSPKTRILNPRVLGPASAVGITLGGFANGSVVRGGDIRGVTTGVQVESDDCTVQGMTIEASSRGVRVLANVDNDVGQPTIGKVRVRDIDIVGNPSVAGVQLQGTSTTTRIVERIYAPDATTLPISPNIPSVTAAATISLPIGAPVIGVAGNTNITSITATGHERRVVTLKFGGTPTVTDGSNLKLAGDFVAAGTTNDHDTLTLMCDGTSWYEVARSIN